MVKVEVKDNGYRALKIQNMIKRFEKAAAHLFPECTIRHFYYGDKLDMADVVLCKDHYAYFNITANRVSLNGHSCNREEMKKFESMTHNDECYNGKLLEISEKITVEYYYD